MSNSFPHLQRKTMPLCYPTFPGFASPRAKKTSIFARRIFSPTIGKKIDRQLPPDHPVRRINELVEQLDLAPLLRGYQHTKRQPLDPKAMLKVVFYEMREQKTRSPAQWHRDSTELLPVLWLLGGLQPGRSTFYDFQPRFDFIIDELNARHLSRCLPPDDARRVAIDGTFIAANATRHRLFNKSRLCERIELLEQRLRDDASEDANEDANEDTQDGTTKTPAWLAPTLCGKMRQRDTYRRALRQLEERLKKNAKLPKNRRKPENKVLISPTDCEAQLGRDKQKTYRPLYNVQVVRDIDSDYILSSDVLTTTSDAGTLEGTFQRYDVLCGLTLSDALTDAGYATERDLIACERFGVRLIAPYRENTLVKSPDEKSGKRYFKKDMFEWNAEREEYRCPNGAALTRKSQEYRIFSDDERLRVFRYACDPASCIACPLSAGCTSVIALVAQRRNAAVAFAAVSARIWWMR